jgi:chaperonin GroES
MSDISIRPLQDRVLVEAAPAEVKTAGGIIIPDTAKEKPQKGHILIIFFSLDKNFKC